MANPVVPKKSSVAAKVPLSTDLLIGELAVNLTDRILYTKDSAGNVITLGGGGSSFSDTLFQITDNADPTKIAKFEVSGITTGTTQTYTLPNVSATLAHTGNVSQSFAGSVSFNNAAGYFGMSTANSNSTLGGGATLSGNTKTILIGSAGASGSTTNISLGSAVAGATNTITMYAVPSLPSQTAAYVFAAPSGAAGTPSFRALVSSDLPTYTGTLTSGQVTTALGFTPYNSSNPNGYISGITSGMVTTALGYTPYNSSNPNGYTTNTGTVTSVSGTGTASGLTLSGTVTSSGSLTLSGTVNELAAGTYAVSISGNAATATNADTLDGQHGSYYQPASTAITTSNIGSQSVNYAASAGSASSAGYLPTSYIGGQQLNPQTYFNNSVGLKVAMTAAAGVWSDTLWINGYSGGDVLSMCALHTQRNGTPRMYISSQNSNATSYGTLYEFLTAYNYTSYAPTLTGSGASGTWGINVTGSSGSCSGNAATATSTQQFMSQSHAGTYYLVNNWDGSRWNVTSNHGAAVRVGYSDTSGNASYSYNYTQGFNSNWNSDFQDTPAGSMVSRGDTSTGSSANAPGGTWWFQQNFRHTNSSNYWGVQVAWGWEDNANILRTRNVTGGSYGSWVTYLNSANYSSYAIGRGGDTVSGVIQYNANQNTTGSNPPLQAYGTSGGAIMAFHRGGYYAVNMGLDSDNVFRIGGWSAAANRLQMDMSGNLTMAGNVTANSDERLKKNWRPVADRYVERLAAIKSGIYDRVDEEMTQAGVSAQSMQALLPEVVGVSADGTLSVAYGNAALVSAVELAKEILALREEIAALKAAR